MKKPKIIAESGLGNGDRQGMINADMERGVQESHERLDELLAKELIRG